MLSVAVVLNRFEKPAKITYLQTTESDRRNGFQASWIPLGEKKKIFQDDRKLRGRELMSPTTRQVFTVPIANNPTALPSEVHCT